LTYITDDAGNQKPATVEWLSQFKNRDEMKAELDKQRTRYLIKMQRDLEPQLKQLDGPTQALVANVAFNRGNAKANAAAPVASVASPESAELVAQPVLVEPAARQEPTVPMAWKHGADMVVTVATASMERWASLARQVAAAATVQNDLFVVPEGLEVTLWATSPHLYNPTNLDIDHAGRIWAAEGVRYRKHFDRQPEGDRIVVFGSFHTVGPALSCV
jgi:hypothetical protein